MSEISNYEAQKKKLQGLCDEHNFTFRFFKDRYPITLVITPINDVATQMDMLGWICWAMWKKPAIAVRILLCAGTLRTAS